MPKLINLKGILNVGGPIRTVYNFAKKYNPYIKKISIKKTNNLNFKKNMSMNIAKFKKICKKKF